MRTALPPESDPMRPDLPRESDPMRPDLPRESDPMRPPSTAIEPAIRPHVPRSRYRLGASRSRRATFAIVAVGVVGLVGYGLVANARICGGPSKMDIGRLTVKKYAYEAFPAFRYANPGRVCPANLGELNTWMDSDGVKDPWGTEYVMHCSQVGIVVRSAGEDRKHGTGDDLGSNE